MSAEPKRDLIDVVNGAGHRVPWFDVVAITRAVEAAGWVSPEEAAAREATARREALLEAADAYSDFEVFVAADGINSLRTHGLEPDAWIRRYSERYTAEPERDEPTSCEAGHPVQSCQGCDAGNCSMLPGFTPEPECDEEGGR